MVMGTVAAATSSAHELSVIPLGEGRSVRLGALLGRGAMAAVYRGVLTAPHKFRRAVAVKVFDRGSTDDAQGLEDAVARVTRKAACVHHPNVLAPLEFAVHEGRPVVLTELVDGCSLDRLQAGHAELRRKMPTDLALFIGLEIAEGLAGARDARTPDGATLNMRHHDLSPRDVLISWHGEVKVTDFGVSAAVRVSSGVTTLESIARRCATMAPEVMSGSRGDARSDVFSLGIIIRQMLVGPRFPAGMNEAEILGLANEGAIPIGLMEPPVRGPVAEILDRALQVEPTRRYPDAGRMAFDLRRAALSMGVGDGRVFLRAAMRDVMGERMLPSDPTNPEPAPRRAKADSGEVATVTAEIDSARHAG